MYEFTQLSLYKLIFVAELAVIEYLFTVRLNRKKHFWRRFIISLLALFGLSAAIPIPPEIGYNFVYLSLMFIVIFTLSVVRLKICYAESWTNLIFCGLASYATQHIAYGLYRMILVIFSLESSVLIGGYGNNFGDLNYLTVMIYLECYAFICFMAWFFFGRTVDNQNQLFVDNTAVLFVSGIILLVAVVLNAIVVYEESLQTRAGLIITGAYDIIACLVTIIMQFSLKDRKNLTRELNIVEQMWHKDKKHFEMSKETIDMINIKCHDLKHQIRAIRLGVDDGAMMLKELEESALIYDSVVKTGNDALDVLLTEKSLYCEKHSILLTCMAEGSALNFMHASDIYSLFGNALDNAIEKVQNYDELEKRFIRLSIKSSSNVVVCHIENWFEGELVLKNGRPVTGKADANRHGYGILSMQAICRKYNGECFYKVKDELFCIDFILPQTGSK